MLDAPAAASSVAATVRRLRLARYLSQEALAEVAGVSVRTVSNLERGSAHRPRPATARQLATALGLKDGQVADFVHQACNVAPVGDAWSGAPTAAYAPAATHGGSAVADSAVSDRARYAELPTGIQRVFRHLAVFTGSFDERAAAAVAGFGDNDSDHAGAVADGSLTSAALASLATAGLIVATGNLDCRFVLSAPASTLASALLSASGDTHAVRRRHALWLAQCLEQSGPEPVVAGTGAWYHLRADLAPEWESALTWTLGAGEHALAARLARCLYRYWAAAGTLVVGTARLDAILAANLDHDEMVLADVRLGAGVLAFTQGQFRAAARHWQVAATASAEAGTPDYLRHGHLQANRGLLAWYGTRNASRALHRFDLARRYFGRAGAAMPLAYMHRNAAVIATACGDFSAADMALRASFRESALAGDASSHAMSLGDLAALSLRQGDHALATSHLRAALTLNDNDAAVLWTLHLLALASHSAIAAGDQWHGTLLQAAVARGRRDCGLPWRSPVAAAPTADASVAPLPANAYGEAWWAGSKLSLAEARALVLAG